MLVPAPFQIGTFTLHPDPMFNFFMNRGIHWDGGDREELRGIAGRITDARSWANELTQLGELALGQGRVGPAIAYLRMSEFFMFDNVPEKLTIYRRARDLFYEHYAEIFSSGRITRSSVPYATGQLPVWHARPAGRPPEDTLLLQGGYDTYLEELLSQVLYLQEKGFEVIAFEGPGQGAALKDHGLPFTAEWHKPVKAVLDQFQVQDVTLAGSSLGSALVLRAAAFEPRVRRVVAWGVVFNFLSLMFATRPKPFRSLLRFFLNLKLSQPVNGLLGRSMKNEPMIKWGLEHGMVAFGVGSPYAQLLKADELQVQNVADRIDQDVLLLGAQRDHLIPQEFYPAEIAALRKARSLTFRLFTAAEHAENHCNVGNTPLALDTIMSWIKGIKARRT